MQEYPGCACLDTKRKRYKKSSPFIKTIKEEADFKQRSYQALFIIMISEALRKKMDSFNEKVENKTISNFSKDLRELTTDFKEQIIKETPRLAFNNGKEIQLNDTDCAKIFDNRVVEYAESKLFKSLENLKKLKKISGPLNQIIKIQEKAEEFGKHALKYKEAESFKKTGKEGKYTKAFNAVGELTAGMFVLMMNYAEEKISLEEFKYRAGFALGVSSKSQTQPVFNEETKENLDTLSAEIRKTLPEIQKHRGLKKILMNLILFFPMVINSLYQRKLTLFGQTDTKRRANDLHNAVRRLEEPSNTPKK